MDLVQSLDLMSDIHSTITTTSGCLFGLFILPAG